MRKITLKSAVKAHFKNFALNGDQLRELQNITHQHVRSRTRFHVNLKQFGIFSAVFILGFFTTLMFTDLREKPTNEMIQLIAEEVVNNHLRLKPLEIETNNLQDIQQYFTELDFVPSNSTLIANMSQKLTGARYCSIQGVTAAQLRLRDGEHTPLNTLYQTQYKQSLFGKLPDIDRGEKPVSTYAKGIQVTVWVEKGLLFALTHQENTE